MHNFVYRSMQSVDQAVAELQKDDDAFFLAGGMTLLPIMKQRLAQPSQLLDLSTIDGLDGIESDDNSVFIGAGATHAIVTTSSVIQGLIPALTSLAGSIGDPQVRNRGTLGGSIANADPSADYPAAVLGLNATVYTNNREIAADDFFIDLFETALDDGELITGVRFPCPGRAAYASFRNPASRYAIVGVFVVDTGKGFRVAVTGAAGSVFRWNECEVALSEGASIDTINNLEVSDAEFNQDIHASAQYRAHLVKVMACKAINSLT